MSDFTAAIILIWIALTIRHILIVHFKQCDEGRTPGQRRAKTDQERWENGEWVDLE